MPRRRLVLFALLAVACLGVTSVSSASSPWLFLYSIPDMEGQKAQLFSYQVTWSQGRCPEGEVFFTLSGWDVPAGMSISNTGLITFTPDDLDAWTITVNIYGDCPGSGLEIDSDSDTFTLVVA